jgi:hypothetical protein
MKIVWIIVSAVVLVLGSTLALMNQACKTGQHTWCASPLDLQHHTKVKRPSVLIFESEAGCTR